jgi:8-oxo-dGTP diphosphatase
MIETPLLTVDGIIELLDDAGTLLGIVLIERKNPPYGWALPGGFVDVGERVEDALIREMKEETSLDVSILSLQNVYSDPERDSRFHTASVVYRCEARGTPRAQDDAKNIRVVPREQLPQLELAFDHALILGDYLADSQA